MQPAAVLRGSCTKEPFVLHVSPDTCPRRLQVRPLGEPIRLQYELANGQCLASLPSTVGQPAFSEGPEIPPEMMVEVTWAHEPGPHRLSPYKRHSPVETQAPDLFFDNTLGVDCEPRIGADGVLRCMPSGVNGHAYFRDPACTVLLADLPAPCDFVPAYDYVHTPGTCSTAYRALHVGKPYTGPVYAVTSGTCQAAMTDRHFFELGDEIPPATFAELREVTR
jgi:hypothetical protein